MTDPWTREDQPFNYSATGYLGRKRPEMLNNHLLQRCQLGRARGAGLGFSQDVIYGNCYRSPFTAAHAVTGWAGGTLLPPQEKCTHPRQRIPHDFLQYNMGSTTQGHTTAEEVRAYRQIRKHIPMIHYGPPREKIVRPPPVKLKPDTVYGIKSCRLFPVNPTTLEKSQPLLKGLLVQAPFEFRGPVIKYLPHGGGS